MHSHSHACNASDAPDQAQALDAAAARCRSQGASLTPIRRQVLALLYQHPKGLKAYDLLALLQEERSNATPPTIYRALDFLLEHGLAHKIGRLNLFVACHHETHQRPSLFLICPRCGSVSELQDAPLMDALAASLRTAGHLLESPEVELSAICPGCQLAGSQQGSPG
jgi:Fur family transcriptional regulator, zinc uptake regulator